MNLPMRAFCLNGDDGRIELQITEVFGFPDNTSYEGGIDVKGSLYISAGCHTARFDDYYFATGVLHRFLKGLEECYQTLKGVAEYRHFLEHDFEFTLKMTSFGRAVINGMFKEYPNAGNKLCFIIKTDQTCIKAAIDDIKNVINTFGDKA